jgi:hypothetical protein
MEKNRDCRSCFDATATTGTGVSRDVVVLIPRASHEKRPDPKLRRHQPDQTPGEGFLERLAIELLLVWGKERDDPAGMVDGPRARAAAGSDRSA